MTDSAKLEGVCSLPGTLTFTLIDVFGKATDFRFDGPDSVKDTGTFPIDSGLIPDVPGTYKWVATYTPMNGGKVIKSDFEKQEVKKKLAVPEPGTLALMLLGVGVLLVTRKHLGQGRPEAT